MSEWLTQITPDTSYQEMFDRPSSFNPYPEQMKDGVFEITGTGIPNLHNANMRHLVRYGTGNIYEVEWPVHQAVTRSQTEIKHLNLGGEELGPQTELAVKNLDRFDYFWESQAAALAHTRLVEDGQHAFDRALSAGMRNGVFNDPRVFMQYNARAFEYSLQRDLPSTAFTIAQSAFSGTMVVHGQKQRCLGLRHWLDENVTHVIEPGISQALHNIHSKRAGIESDDMMHLDRLRRDLAMHAIYLAQSNWIMRSLKRADEYYADKNPALTEKIVWHQVVTGKEAIITAKDLTELMNTIPKKIRGTTSLRPELQTPQQIGSYVLDIIN
jgi:hypothetical protein